MRLLEGLEITEIPLRNMLANDRADSEFWLKNYLQDEKIISHLKNSERLRNLLDVFYRYPTFYGFDFGEDGVPVLKGEDIDSMGLMASKSGDHVTEAISQEFPLTVVLAGDLVVSVRGSVGKVGLVGQDLAGAQLSPNVIRLSPNSSKVIPEYLWAFLRSRFGIGYFDRFKMRTSQETILASDISNFTIPLTSRAFQQKISAVVHIAQGAFSDSRCTLVRAENILTNELGLDDWQAPEPLTYVCNSSEAFTAERFDAEYFYPAKLATLEKLRALSDCQVGDLFFSVKELWPPDKGAADEQVRNYDLTDALNPFLDETKEPLSRYAIASTKKVIRTGDLVVSRLRSYLKEIAIVRGEHKVPTVASTEFIVLRPKPSSTLPVEALLIYLRSELPQLVFKWSQDGSNHPRFGERELLHLPVPRALVENSEEYVNAIKSMIDAKQHATQLLEAAKRAVEIAIEQSEAEALAYLNNIIATTGA